MMDLAFALLLALNDEPAAKPATAAAVQAPDADRPPIPASEIKALRDSNIFSPWGLKKRQPPTGPKPPKDPPPPPKPKAPVVTGIFFDAKENCFLVVVEDRNEASLRLFKEPKFLKTGDEVLGLKIGPVTAEKACFLKGDVAKDLVVGDTVPTTDLKPASTASASTDDAETSPSDGEEKVDIKPLDSEEKTKVLEQMKKQRGKKNRPSHDDQ